MLRIVGLVNGEAAVPGSADLHGNADTAQPAALGHRIKSNFLQSSGLQHVHNLRTQGDHGGIGIQLRIFATETDLLLALTGVVDQPVIFHAAGVSDQQIIQEQLRHGARHAGRVAVEHHSRAKGNPLSLPDIIDIGSVLNGIGGSQARLQGHFRIGHPLKHAVLVQPQTVLSSPPGNSAQAGVIQTGLPASSPFAVVPRLMMGFQAL